MPKLERMYAFFEMEVVEDKFSFVGTCFHGRFVDILDLQINSESAVDRRNEKDMCSQSLGLGGPRRRLYMISHC